MKITKDMIIGDVVKEHSEVAEVFFDHGLHCIGCAVSLTETIEDGCKGHGFDDKEIDKMIEEMNAAVEKRAEEKGDKKE